MKIACMILGLLVVTSLAQEPSTITEKSVKPGINTKYLDPNLKVDDWLKRFEVESREVFDSRKAILEACGVKAGMKVADIGAGTGLYSRLFSEAVGKKGWVYAVDINARFLEHIHARARQEKQTNITTVLSPQDSVSLPPRSINLAFICDTYHHFEYPRATLASLVKALKPKGTLVVVDFERVEGKSSEWTLGHVRAGKEVFRKEIEEAGLKFVEEIEVEGLVENYFLLFTKA